MNRGLIYLQCVRIERAKPAESGGNRAASEKGRHKTPFHFCRNKKAFLFIIFSAHFSSSFSSIGTSGGTFVNF